MFYHSRPQYVIAEDPTSYPIPDIEPVHLLWSSRKDIVTLRKKFLWQLIQGSIELWILIFVITALYLGAGHNPSRYTNNLVVALVDFDGDVAGSYFLNAFRQSPPGNLTLNWRYKYPSDYNNNIDEIRNDVVNGRVWAIVALRPNTTSLINNSLFAFTNTTTLLTSPFSSTLPFLVMYEEGRSSTTLNNYVLPPIRSAIAVASARYGQILRQELIDNLSTSSNSNNNRSLQLINTFQLGSLLADPLEAQYQNLNPAFPFVGTLASTLGYIYLFLTSGIVVGSALKFVSPLVGKIHVLDLMLYRIFNGALQALVVSLIYSLIVLWFFGIHSGSLFMRYWMFNWLVFLMFGLLVVLFTVNLGLLGNSLLIIFIVFMLAGATIQITLELSPRFFRYGYGLPLYHAVNGGRHLLFKSYSDLGLDVGVLLIYYSVLFILAIVTSAYSIKRQERKIVKELQKKKQDKKGYSIATIARH